MNAEDDRDWLGMPTEDLVEAMSDGLVVVDSAGIIRWANTLAHDQFGYPPPGLIGRPVEALLEPGAQVLHTQYREGFSDQPRLMASPDRSQVYGHRADGTVIPLKIALAPLSTGAGPVTLAIVRDMTDINDLENHIALLQGQQAQAAARSRRHHNQRDHIAQELFGISLVVESLADRSHEPGTLRQVADHLSQLIRLLHDNEPE